MYKSSFQAVKEEVWDPRFECEELDPNLPRAELNENKKNIVWSSPDDIDRSNVEFHESRSLSFDQQMLLDRGKKSDDHRSSSLLVV